MTRTEKVATVLLWSLAAALAGRLRRIAGRAAAHPTSGFAAYHAAARLLVARALFIVSGLAALGLAVFLLARFAGLEGPLAAAFALVIPPVVENVRNGQAYSVLLAVAVIALAAGRRRRSLGWGA